jgi:hypothetical protein
VAQETHGTASVLTAPLIAENAQLVGVLQLKRSSHPTGSTGAHTLMSQRTVSDTNS